MPICGVQDHKLLQWQLISETIVIFTYFQILLTLINMPSRGEVQVPTSAGRGSFLESLRLIFQNIAKAFRSKPRAETKSLQNNPDDSRIVKKSSSGLNCLKGSQSKKKGDEKETYLRQSIKSLEESNDNETPVPSLEVPAETTVIVEPPPRPGDQLSPEISQLISESMMTMVDEGLRRHKEILFGLTDGPEFCTESQMTKYHQTALERTLQEYRATYEELLPPKILEEYGNILSRKISLQLVVYWARYEHRVEKLQKKISALAFEAATSYDDAMEQEDIAKLSEDTFKNKHQELVEELVFNFQEKLAELGVEQEMIQVSTNQVEFQLQEKFTQYNKQFLDDVFINEEPNSPSSDAVVSEDPNNQSSDKVSNEDQNNRHSRAIIRFLIYTSLEQFR
ncbi:unnamed protein product [Allacma fusca]|uniref:Uncharacterized protein n=1 Tax=Allacma fusca TaxID=39272 RepID=A0A8J2P4F4_9HEXA|nr:unnamed protein product [Allacma fusca]